jgi:uncharacterized protein
MLCMSTGEVVGWVGALWRYPVKSMLGERLQSAIVTENGFLGDRAYALIDRLTGNVGSTKNPRKWGFLLECKARFDRPLKAIAPLPPAMITLPDGTCIETDQPAACELLSKALGREVTIACGGTEKPMVEKYWPEVANLDYQSQLTREAIVENTFFDGDPVHLLTTGSLSALSALYPSGYFDACRFRPNIVISTLPERRLFVENDWVGHTLEVGPHVLFHIKRPTRRCVITTLAQGELPRDLGILKTAAQHNAASVGVYAAVLRGGTITENDQVTLT